mgnify:CR=1 FL=1
MAKKKVPVAGNAAEPAAEPVVVDSGVILVNREKVERATEILALVTGKKVAKNSGEEERRDRFTAVLAEKEIKPNSKGALQAVYEILGGLVRTPEEQEAADENAADIRKKNKKRAIEPDR